MCRRCVRCAGINKLRKGNVFTGVCHSVRGGKVSMSGTDLGFPVGGGANPPGEGRQHTNLPDFPKNCMKLRNFWSVGEGAHRGVPLGSATACDPWCIAPHCTAPPPTPAPAFPPNMGHGDPLHLPQPWPQPPASDIWWPSLETSSSLFIGPHCTAPSPHHYWHLVATNEHTVDKRAVRILLECFLVYFKTFGLLFSN